MITNQIKQQIIDQSQSHIIAFIAKIRDKNEKIIFINIDEKFNVIGLSTSREILGDSKNIALCIPIFTYLKWEKKLKQNGKTSK